MYNIDALDVNDAYYRGRQILEAHGYRAPSRVGEVVTILGPVVTETEYPMRRVLFDAARDANPIFHLFEGFWMLAGRRDVEWITHYNGQMKSYSDDGVNYHGAYGYRWRKHFSRNPGGRAPQVVDQLELVVQRLRQDPFDRRVVIQMWDPSTDLDVSTLDVPCNTTIYPRIIGGRLDLTVCCRSNDAIWGCHGSNAVHFSVLQEYLASRIGVGVGRLYQLSNNYHAYTSVLDRYPIDFGDQPVAVLPISPYIRFQALYASPMFSEPDDIDDDIKDWMKNPDQMALYANPFFGETLVPMAQTWEYWKEKKLEKAMEAARRIFAPDWRAATRLWIARRMRKRWRAE